MTDKEKDMKFYNDYDAETFCVKLIEEYNGDKEKESFISLEELAQLCNVKIE